MMMCLDSRRTRSGAGALEADAPRVQKHWRLLAPEDKRSALALCGCPETAKTVGSVERREHDGW